MKLVIFDFDGTLVDSRPAVAATLNAALQTFGFPAVADDAIVALIGLPLTEMFPRLVGRPLTQGELITLVDAYRGRYLAEALTHERIYDGIFDLLADLSRAGRRLAVATGKSTAGARRGAERWGLQLFLERIYGFDAVPHPKPAPDLLLRIMDELDVPATDTVIVGDTEFDVEMGRRAGTATIGVTWGSHPADRLADADAVVDDIGALRAALALS